MIVCRKPEKEAPPIGDGLLQHGTVSRMMAFLTVLE
jgi:hypothetical protein